MNFSGNPPREDRHPGQGSASSAWDVEQEAVPTPDIRQRSLFMAGLLTVTNRKRAVVIAEGQATTAWRYGAIRFARLGIGSEIYPTAQVKYTVASVVCEADARELRLVVSPDITKRRVKPDDQSAVNWLLEGRSRFFTVGLTRRFGMMPTSSQDVWGSDWAHRPLSVGEACRIMGSSAVEIEDSDRSVPGSATPPVLVEAKVQQFQLPCFYGAGPGIKAGNADKVLWDPIAEVEVPVMVLDLPFSVLPCEEQRLTATTELFNAAETQAETMLLARDICHVLVGPAHGEIRRETIMAREVGSRYHPLRVDLPLTKDGARSILAGNAVRALRALTAPDSNPDWALG